MSKSICIIVWKCSSCEYLKMNCTFGPHQAMEISPVLGLLVHMYTHLCLLSGISVLQKKASLFNVHCTIRVPKSPSKLQISHISQSCFLGGYVCFAVFSFCKAVSESWFFAMLRKSWIYFFLVLKCHLNQNVLETVCMSHSWGWILKENVVLAFSQKHW